MLTADHFDRDGLYIVQLGDGTLTAIEVQATYADAGADGIAPIIRIVIEVGLSGRIPLPSWIGSMRKTANGVILARYVDPEKNIFGPEFTFDLRRRAWSVATGRIIVDAGNPIALAELEIQANAGATGYGMPLHGNMAGNLRVWIGDTNGGRPAAWADWDAAGQPASQLTPADPVPHGAEWFRVASFHSDSSESLWAKYQRIVEKELPAVLPVATAATAIPGETEKRYWFDMGDAVICRTVSGDIVYHPAPADATGDEFEQI